MHQIRDGLERVIDQKGALQPADQQKRVVPRAPLVMVPRQHRRVVIFPRAQQRIRVALVVVLAYVTRLAVVVAQANIDAVLRCELLL